MLRRGHDEPPPASQAAADVGRQLAHPGLDAGAAQPSLKVDGLGDRQPGAGVSRPLELQPA